MSKSLQSLVTDLKRANAAYARLQKKRDAVRANSGRFFPSDAEHAIQKKVDKGAGAVMRLERQIIEALLK